MNTKVDFYELDRLTAELAQPVVAGSEDAREALLALSLAIVKNDMDGFEQALAHPFLKNAHKIKPTPFILRNSDQFMNIMPISFAGYLGFLNRPELLDKYLSRLDKQEAKMVVLDALHGAKFSTSSQDMIKHLVRNHDINLTCVLPEDFKRLIRRKDHDLMAFFLGRGACPNAMGMLGGRPPLFEALAQKDDAACNLLLAANVIQVIADTPESHDFIDSIEISHFIETHTDHLAFRKWLANQSCSQRVRDHSTIAELRSQTYTFDYKGNLYTFNGLMLKALNRNFDEVIKMMIETDEVLTREDLYGEQGGDVCVMDMLNHPDFDNDNILDAKNWIKAPFRIKEFYKTLSPYDKYYRETALMHSAKTLFDPERKMQDVRVKMQTTSPLKRRPKRAPRP